MGLVLRVRDSIVRPTPSIRKTRSTEQGVFVQRALLFLRTDTCSWQVHEQYMQRRGRDDQRGFRVVLACVVAFRLRCPGLSMPSSIHMCYKAV